MLTQNPITVLKISKDNNPKTNLSLIPLDSNHSPPQSLFPKGALLKKSKIKFTIGIGGIQLISEAKKRLSFII
jgi:hypothetical protein